MEQRMRGAATTRAGSSAHWGIPANRFEATLSSVLISPNKLASACLSMCVRDEKFRVAALGGERHFRVSPYQTILMLIATHIVP